MSHGEVREHLDSPMWLSHMKFLETIEVLWAITRRRWHALNDGPRPDMDVVWECDEEQKPIVARAQAQIAETLKYRYAAMLAYEKDSRFRAEEDERCKADPIHWINMWCMTTDPRLVALKICTELPLIMWPKQEEFVLFVDDCMKYRIRWLAEKSRGWGLTWLSAAYACWHWKYSEHFVGGFGSRDKDAVDKIGDPDTIFSKVRHIIYNLPHSMRPASYQNRNGLNPSTHDNYMRIVNPDNRSVIRGAGGDNIGAGGRASIYFVDEKALVERQEKVDAALSYTAECQGDISTVRGMNAFGEKRHSGRVQVFTAWWYQDPAKNSEWRTDRRPKDNEWYQYQLDTLGQLTVAQEVDISYTLSVEDAVIPAEWVQAAVDFDIPAEGSRQAGFDIAGSGENKSVYVLRVGSVIYQPKTINFNTPQEALEEALEFATEDKAEFFAYDEDGLGQSVWGHIKITERKVPFYLYGVHGNDSASDRYLYEDGKTAREKYANKRAENWWNIRERFRKTYEHVNEIRMYDHDELISIPNDQGLITQLSQPKRVRGRGNRLGVEGKKDMRARGVKSPDDADAVVNAFAEVDKESRVMRDYDYREEHTPVRDFDGEMDFESPVGTQYVSLVQSEDFVTYALCCWWNPNPNAPLLRVYWEFVEHKMDVKTFVNNIRLVTQEQLKPIREWVCNEELFKGVSQGKMAPWQLYRKEHVYLRQNYTNDWEGSIMLVNQMFSNRMIEIHPRAERLHMQLTNWKMEKGRPQSNLGLAMALCQIVTRLRTKKEIKKQHLSPQWKPKRPYKNAIAHFGRSAKPEELPSYYKKALEQSRAAHEQTQGGR